ncbi:hypothetical protein UVI_02010800 [Ustilaginoidea virens]|uniref:Uncharacterized protein n=1 Tax=Ustilaginoidea virens TaxID=1159556 RepID=A0A063C6M8_USTVR|nr:hypothetical protein UVI_02010800 [Ustilaginoidea virens]
MKALVVVATALVGLGLAAPAGEAADLLAVKRSPAPQHTDNLFKAAKASFREKAVSDSFYKRVKLSWGSNLIHACGFGCNGPPLAVLINEYVAFLNIYLSKGQDEKASDAMTQFALEGSNPDHPVVNELLWQTIIQISKKVNRM